jgi:DNA-directed RNA polymerase subunit RPC12/RpoP
MLSDTQLTDVVRQARCERCNGKGFRRIPKEDLDGERIGGEYEYIDCPRCHGDGIRIHLCRQLAAIHSRGTPSTTAILGKA